MDLIGYLTSKHQIWEQYRRCSTTKLDVSDIWRASGGSASIVKHNLISDSQIESWLTSNSLRPDDAKDLPRVLRMLWIVHDPLTLRDHISQHHLNDVIKAFDLASASAYSTTVFAGATAIPPVLGHTDHHLRRYSFCTHPKLVVSWSYDGDSAISSGICFASMEQIAALKQILDLQWYFHDHEMTMAYACCLLLSREVDESQQEIKQEVRAVEARTGYHRWRRRDDEQAAEGQLARLSANMSGAATKLESVLRKTSIVLHLIDFLIEELERQTQRDATTGIASTLLTTKPQLVSTPRNTTTLACESRIRMKDEALILKSRARMQSLDTDFIRKRIDIQLTALFNLIAQYDTLISHEAAKDSKLVAIASQRDSSSMKILAVVTMVFLPGAFVASLFSADLFSWDATSHRTAGTNASRNTTVDDTTGVNENFKIFWYITIPLTIAILAFAILASMMLHRKHREENLKTERQASKAKGNEIGALLEMKALNPLVAQS